MDTSPEPAATYLRDLGGMIKTEALHAKLAAELAGGDEAAFAAGRLSALYQVTSLMLQQAKSFGLDSDAVGLLDFDPDSELLSPP